MKWKCTKCSYGPCVYQTGYSKMLMDTRCFNDMDMENTKANWRPMSGEEPERKEESGLPEWLRVGNFVKFGGCNPVCRIEGYDTEQKILSISRKVWREDRTVKDDVHCEAGWGEAQVVFPKPYTFDTAPVMFKAQRKADGAKVVLCLDAHNNCLTAFGAVGETGTIFISFADVLRYYEQLDGWPCGTFDEEA